MKLKILTYIIISTLLLSGFSFLPDQVEAQPPPGRDLPDIGGYGDFCIDIITELTHLLASCITPFETLVMLFSTEVGNIYPILCSPNTQKLLGRALPALMSAVDGGINGLFIGLLGAAATCCICMPCILPSTVILGILAGVVTELSKANIRFKPFVGETRKWGI